MSTEPPPSRPAASPPALTGPRWAWFAAWLVIGAGYALSLLGAASIGLFMLPLPVLATILLARRQHANAGLPGLISGLGIPLLYVAYLNRAGPGTICTMITGGGQDCTDEWSPWPWLAAGVVLLVLGAAAFIARQRHLPRQSTNLRS
jgi:MYXO-CTERM domain-containing protein